MESSNVRQRKGTQVLHESKAMVCSSNQHHMRFFPDAPPSIFIFNCSSGWGTRLVEYWGESWNAEGRWKAVPQKMTMKLNSQKKYCICLAGVSIILMFGLGPPHQTCNCIGDPTGLPTTSHIITRSNPI